MKSSKKPAKKKAKCRHQWKTTRSYGAWGHDARCTKCGEQGTFTISEDHLG